MKNWSEGNLAYNLGRITAIVLFFLLWGLTAYLVFH